MTAESARQSWPAFVNLPALLASVLDQAVLADPAIGALMVEYACWEVHLAEWRDRQPPRSHRDYDDWIGEGRGLFDQRDDLKGTAYGLLRCD